MYGQAMAVSVRSGKTVRSEKAARSENAAESAVRSESAADAAASENTADKAARSENATRTEKSARSEKSSRSDKPTSGSRFNGVKVFSATMVADHEKLGDKVTEWIAAHPNHRLEDIVVTQSSDRDFHCVAISVFYTEPLDS